MGEKIEEDIYLGSSPVYRLSCGCARQTENSYSAEVEAFFESKDDTVGVTAAADRILSEYIPSYT